MSMFRTLIAVAAASFALSSALEAQPSPLDARYDDSIPSAETALGYAFGEEITPPEDAVAYMYTLAEAAPDRLRVTQYAESWEGRPLVYGVIARPEIMARLDEVQADLQRLAEPRGLADADREALIASLPAVVWLSYGVHGDEISSTDAGLRSAYHLLAAQDDPTVEMILENTIVIIDPTQNPDGRARFVASFTAARGLVPDESRFSAEHDQPWPGGRYNHYLFDMNRDWFAMTQPESRGRVRAVLDWRPVVVVDVHEMGGDSTYFFAPSAEPFNPHIADSQRSAQDLIGRNHARWFDQLGYSYFTREIFDAFYPGYGDMWPTLQGAVAMTYEQASSRGLAWRRRDGSLLTYGDAVDHHFVSSISTAEVVAANRTRFVRDFADFRSAAVSASAGPQSVLLSRDENRWAADRLARNLVAQDIEVEYLEGAFAACGARFSDGAYQVRLDQPSGRLARTLLEDTTPLPADFVAEQESRRARGLGHELYDVTAWSLPLMHNVEATECRRAATIVGQAVDADAPLPGGIGNQDASWGYVIPWTDAGQARLVAALAADGVALRSTDEAFRIGDREFPRGSVILQRHGAAPDLDARIARHASSMGARAEGLASSWVDEGPNPGSSAYRPVRAPRIAMLWGQGTTPTDAGATRYVLEQRYNIPVTIIRAGSLAHADLSAFDVLIMPEQGRGGYARILGASGASTVQGFVRSGGVLVGLGDATRWMASSAVGLIPAQRERAAGTPRESGDDAAVTEGVVLDTLEAMTDAEAETAAMPDSSPGALVRVEANPDAWMSAGYDGGATALFTGSDIYAPVEMGEAVTALRYGDADTLVQGGYLWAENTAQLGYKPFVLSRSYGAGQVIAFTQSPSTRAYLEGLDLLLLNAVLLGPAHSRALR
jgi:hypothetical protein